VSRLVKEYQEGDAPRREWVLAVLVKGRGHAALDMLATRCDEAPDSALPELLGALEQVLGRTVDGTAVGALGSRRAALLLLATVAAGYQPPGEGLLLW